MRVGPEAEQLTASILLQLRIALILRVLQEMPCKARPDQFLVQTQVITEDLRDQTPVPIRIIGLFYTNDFPEAEIGSERLRIAAIGLALLGAIDVGQPDPYGLAVMKDLNGIPVFDGYHLATESLGDKLRIGTGHFDQQEAEEQGTCDHHSKELKPKPTQKGSGAPTLPHAFHPMNRSTRSGMPVPTHHTPLTCPEDMPPWAKRST